MLPGLTAAALNGSWFDDDMNTTTACELCIQMGGDVVHQNPKLRVVLVDDEHYPGFCRVIWNEHAKEMTELLPVDRILFMNTVWQVEAAICEVMHPDKINLASLGNMTPHLHWHVIPRYADDAHFPSPVWAERQRTPAETALQARRELLPLLRDAIVKQLGHIA
jgi:diadenosine tetraphosphate (Ap4A) HIT family hydrolase